jgi:hypothetical protein
MAESRKRSKKRDRDHNGKRNCQKVFTASMREGDISDKKLTLPVRVNLDDL